MAWWWWMCPGTVLRWYSAPSQFQAKRPRSYSSQKPKPGASLISFMPPPERFMSEDTKNRNIERRLVGRDIFTAVVERLFRENRFLNSFALDDPGLNIHDWDAGIVYIWDPGFPPEIQ